MNHLPKQLLTESLGVHILDMDYQIREHIVKNEDGSFTILINSRLNYEQQLKAYTHALEHIMNNDFSQYCANTIEDNTHKRLKSYKFHNTTSHII